MTFLNRMVILCMVLSTLGVSVNGYAYSQQVSDRCSRVLIELRCDQFSTISTLIHVKEGGAIELSAYNDEDSIGPLYYRIFQEQRLLVDEEDGPEWVTFRNVIYHGEMLPGMNVNQKMSVSPGHYFVELYSKCVSPIPSLPIAFGHGRAQLLSVKA